MPLHIYLLKLARVVEDIERDVGDVLASAEVDASGRAHIVLQDVHEHRYADVVDLLGLRLASRHSGGPLSDPYITWEGLVDGLDVTLFGPYVETAS